MAQNTKKVILFIVEGSTDESALSPILKKIFQSKEVRFHVVRGDMTSEWSVSGTNAIEKVHEHMKIEMGRYGYRKQDIIKVIHLIDTDGAFITEDKVIHGGSKDIKYWEDRIESLDPKQTAERNERKSQVLRRLCSVDKVGTIPYCVYYFSRNLEHVLHNDNRNLTIEEKVGHADNFADEYNLNPDKFKSFISSSDVCVSGDYKDTWNFIMEDVNSLCRHSNLHLLFQGE